ncbi:MAG: hypothetical protein LBR20_07795 [Propionibacteriaceae bacterium]|jgi:methanol--5-hydroxybenzimidazolylcobamide Co-methyltransferase|nr:hypothetical protein [Propionibacteriaceae bacterium]
MRHTTLAIADERQLVFGQAPKPVTTRRGLVFGGGLVYPELNFTLPPMSITAATMGEVREHYRSIVSEAIDHARHLDAHGLVLEFETLLELTQHPDWGVSVVELMEELCEKAWDEHHFPTAIRLTPNDLREFDRPPKNRTSSYLDAMFELFERGAAAGGDLLSIESTGGKEVHDEALMMCDLSGVVFSLAVLGVRDMAFLWPQIVEIAGKHGRIPGGDTACGFANTAMVLAEQGFIPKTFAALVRVISAVRTLVAVEVGALGPDKDCGYEGPFLKAITGTPISMEGAPSACAHFSPVGNIAACAADLWSNESVQDVKLLAGMAPIVSLEQLEYDCRFFNQATAAGPASALAVRNLLAGSDQYHDPQALVLAPENVIAISKAIVSADSYVGAAIDAAGKALEIIKAATASGQLELPEIEQPWPDMLGDALAAVPRDEGELTEQMLGAYGDKYLPAEYC